MSTQLLVRRVFSGSDLGQNLPHAIAPVQFRNVSQQMIVRCHMSLAVFSVV